MIYFYTFFLFQFRVSIHFFKSSIDKLLFKNPSVILVELDTLCFSSKVVLPKPLPPDVAKRMIVLFEKSCFSRNVFTTVGATPHQIGKPKKTVSYSETEKLSSTISQISFSIRDLRLMVTKKPKS